VKRNPSVELPFEQDSQQQISAEQVVRSARGVRYLQATAELDRQDQDRPSCTGCAETSDERQGGRGPKHDPSPLDREEDACRKEVTDVTMTMETILRRNRFFSDAHLESLFLPTCLASGLTLCTAEGHPVASCSTWIQA